MTTESTTVVEGCHFLEAPRWHENRVWFSDFYGHQVRSVREDGSDVRVEAEVPGQPAGLGWLPDGRLLVVSMTDQQVLRRELDGTLVTHGDLSGHATGLCNDMSVDDQGRAYVGNFGFDLMAGAPIAPASLHRVDLDGTVTAVADDLWFPNGSVITDDGTFIVAETFGNRLSAFDLTDEGELVNRRVFAEFGPLPATSDLDEALPTLNLAPDGISDDGEGGVWIADATGSRLVRVDKSGTITDEVHPGTPVFACLLGGSGGRTLFACAAPDFHDDARKAATEGRLVSVQV
jgi:sugar lactone lactonase YvrE